MNKTKSPTKSPSKLAIQTAEDAWTKPTTSHKIMDTELAIVFAEIIDDIWSKAWLGNATTEELLNEVAARVDLNYKTTESDEERKERKERSQNLYF